LRFALARNSVLERGDAGRRIAAWRTLPGACDSSGPVVTRRRGMCFECCPPAAASFGAEARDSASPRLRRTFSGAHQTSKEGGRRTSSAREAPTGNPLAGSRRLVAPRPLRMKDSHSSHRTIGPPDQVALRSKPGVDHSMRSLSPSPCWVAPHESEAAKSRATPTIWHGLWFTRARVGKKLAARQGAEEILVLVSRSAGRSSPVGMPLTYWSQRGALEQRRNWLASPDVVGALFAVVGRWRSRIG